MLPRKKVNIYPASDENILAAIDFFFTDTNIKREDALEKIKETSMSLNQIEFLLRKLSEAIKPVFKDNLSTLTVANLVQYGIDALVKNDMFNGSKNRNRITKEFKDFVERTEIDLDFLERNN